MSTADEAVHDAPVRTAFFTATSAVRVTGLVVVDTPSHWSTTGHVVLLVLLQTTGFALRDVVFEAVSATSVVGLSTGITDDLPAAAVWFVTAAMFVGRVGPVAVAAAVAGTERRRLYRYPEAKPLIG